MRNAIVEKLKKENGLEYTAAQISCANGAKQSVCNTILVLVNPGDEVIGSGSLLGKLPGNGENGEGTPVIVSAGIEQRFQDYSGTAGSCYYSENESFDSLFSVQPDRFGIYKRRIAGLSAVLAKHPQVIVIADEITNISITSRNIKVSLNSLK